MTGCSQVHDSLTGQSRTSGEQMARAPAEPRGADLLVYDRACTARRKRAQALHLGAGSAPANSRMSLRSCQCQVIRADAAQHVLVACALKGLHA